ncbi:MAG: RluA family pseudouridine synthase [Spirochaetales bacterium]|jgi:tRNA pseudouridine32 synthase/23S rRNA pseudouridine746 synthase|nr:RluA family pseudouridine synthase [Spirochaetales bacterium]
MVLGSGLKGEGGNPPDRPLEFLYSDDDLAVINKPPGLLSTPGKEETDCAAARIRAAFPGAPENPAVHRLDMDTSGVMVFALNKKAHRELSLQFMERRVAKGYIALLEGLVEGAGGEILLRFRLDPENRPFQILDPAQGREARTLWENLGGEEFPRASGVFRSRILFTPLTGRTHQLRFSAACPEGLGCPILGDRLYGRRGERLFLHARNLEFLHPRTGAKMVFFVPPEF